ncbi:hypothetical protein HQO37_03695 [Rhodococcus fascians]|nr:hypothetical protein [Rhodococcus fascians]MBY4246672.1 hypothetical protein [Rhodococcus fascians]
MRSALSIEPSSYSRSSGLVFAMNLRLCGSLGVTRMSQLVLSNLVDTRDSEPPFVEEVVMKRVRKQAVKAVVAVGSTKLSWMTQTKIAFSAPSSLKRQFSTVLLCRRVGDLR